MTNTVMIIQQMTKWRHQLVLDSWLPVQSLQSECMISKGYFSGLQLAVKKFSSIRTLRDAEF